MKKKGFTLIELMITIAVIGLLAAIALPRFAGATEDAKVANVQGNLASLRTATHMYMAKNGDSGVHEMFNVRAQGEGGNTDFVDIKDDFYETFYPKKKIPAFPTGKNLDYTKAGITYSEYYDGKTPSSNTTKTAYIAKVKNDHPKSTFIEVYVSLAADTYGANIEWGEF